MLFILELKIQKPKR